MAKTHEEHTPEHDRNILGEQIRRMRDLAISQVEAGGPGSAALLRAADVLADGVERITRLARLRAADAVADGSVYCERCSAKLRYASPNDCAACGWLAPEARQRTAGKEAPSC